MKLFLSLLISALYLFNVTTLHAAPNQFITIVNPIRGSDFFTLEGQKPIDNVRKQWSEVEKRNLSATWLIRPDNFKDSEMVSFMKTMPQTQELGLFMEITPTWAEQAGVGYRKGANWHSAGSLFLTGYEVEERKKLIDFAFEEFKLTFGYYPKSVGAWWIDSNSLSYMIDKYKIVANMDVADQYTTDNYQVWGQYFSTPFYPSKRNALIPASGESQKIGVVTIQWAARDPYNSYGNGVLDSTYSVQANDYANPKFHTLNIDYFKKLLNIYLDNPYSSFGQVTVGLENDFSWEDFGGEFSRQLDEVSMRQKRGTKVSTMSSFATFYSSFSTSPPQIILAEDPLESGGKVVWFQSPRYRVGWFSGTKSEIKDLRLYKDGLDEPCFDSPCQSLNLAMMEDQSIDEVTHKNSLILDEGRVTNVKVTPLSNGLRISYINASGIEKVLEFLPNDIKINSTIKPISVIISEAVNSSKSADKIDHNFGTNLLKGGTVLKHQLLNFVLFIIFAVGFFYLPGLALIVRSNLGQNAKFLLSWVLGIVVFTLFSYVLGYVKFIHGLWILPLVGLLVVRKGWVFPKVIFNKEILLCSLVIIAGSVSWLLTSVKNGLLYDYGLGFWGAHGHDAIWHLGLIESLKNGLPVQNPIFAGLELSNYHYFFDLLVASTSTLSGIGANDLYFRYFPVVVSVLIGLLTFIVARVWFKRSFIAILACFFVYFGGSFGWVLSFIQKRDLSGETTFWAQQGISTLINPPFAISLLIFLAGLYLFYKVLEQKNQFLDLMVPLIILWGSIIEFKAYAGVLVLGGLGFVTLVQFIKKDWSLLKIFLPTLGLSLIVFLPNNLGGTSLLVFSPFWLIHSMVDFPDRLSFARLSYARAAGQETGNYLKLLGAEGLGLLIFLMGNLGTRIVGLISLIKNISLKPFNLFIMFFLALSLILPLLFIQKGANYNIIQFFYYFLFILNFFTAASLVVLIDKFKVVGMVLTALVIILTLPTTWDSLHHFIPSRPPARISRLEVEALSFLKMQPEGIVLSFYDEKLREKLVEPIPLFAYAPTGYVGAFSAKSEFVADTINLDIIGIDFKGRLQTRRDILALKEPEIVKKLLIEGGIEYIYVPREARFAADETRFHIKRIFENAEVEIFRVKL